MKNPTSINFRNKSRLLEIVFGEEPFELPYEFLRVFSPSAEVQGHTPEEKKLQVGKRDVTITDVQPVGEYALKITFSDGHDSGLYSWVWLYEIGVRKDQLWEDYLSELTQAGASRDPDDPANLPFIEKKKPSCPNH